MSASRLVSGPFPVAVSTAVFVVMLGALSIAPDSARAEDIDLFTSDSGQASAPNLYIIVDNSANWSSNLGTTTKKKAEHEALEAVFTDPDLAGSGTTDDPIQLRLGFGLFSDSNKPKGGKVWRAVQDVTDAYQTDIRSMLYEDTDGDGNPDVAAGNENLPKANNAPYALSFNEAHAYFAGAAPVAGTADGDHDPDAIASDGTYATPAAGNCGKNYVVLIGNGEPDSGEDNDAEDKLDAHGGRLAQDPIEIDPDNFESNWSDEYARFMAGSNVVPESVRGAFEQNVRTYVIDVHDPDSNQSHTQKWKAARSWLKSIAKWGDGLYFEAHDTQDIKDALQRILDELFAVNSVFAASTLPVSVNVRGTNLNQVYMGVFRPDDSDRTRWQGNLKLYKLEVDEDTNTLYLASRDTDGDGKAEPAQSPATGFIVNTAESYWTHASNYWAYDPRGTPESGSDLPDGEVVEKGGVHQRIRDEHGTDPATTRTLYTYTGSCSNSDGCAFQDFDLSHSAIDSASLGTADSTEAQALMDWMHGANNVPDSTDTNDPDTKTTAAIRPSVHGDVLHARPAVINYGDLDPDDGVDENTVLAFYGANDGIFHAVKAGMEPSDYNEDATDPPSGAKGMELWGFIPPEFYDRLKPLRDMDFGKEYHADGSIGVYKADKDGDGVIEHSYDVDGDGIVAPGEGDKVFLYISMRRGGRTLYALNVSDHTNPKFLWKIDQTHTGFSELGYTWSHPDVNQIRYENALGVTVTKDVLIFGGGYDPGHDDPDATGSPSMGRALFVVDAITGESIWQAGSSPSGATYNHTVADMDYSIPSDVTVLDRNGDGYADRAYVGDTGGQVWRADISGSPDTWKVYKLADDGDQDGDGVRDRKFLYPPDVVYDNESDGDPYDAVLLGTGDRAAPFKTSVTNRFYMFKDRQTGLTVNETEWQTLTEADLEDATGTTSAENIDANEGWYIDLVAGGTGTGEKVVSSAVTLGGTVFFNTNEPPDQTADCSQTLGTARHYQVSFDDASPTTENNNESGDQTDDRYSEAVGGGFPPSPVPVIVEIDGKKYEVVLSGTEAMMPPSSKLGRRSPVYRQTELD